MKSILPLLKTHQWDFEMLLLTKYMLFKIFYWCYQKWPQDKWRNKFPIRIHKKILKSILSFSISNDLAYLTVVDQVMPYEEGFKSSANQKWLLKNILLTAINLFETPRLDFFIAIVRYSFNGQIFDFSGKITSMYYFSNLAYALLLHIVVKSCQLPNLKVCTQCTHSVFWSAPWFLKIKVLQNQSLLQTLEKFQVLQTWIFFSRSPPKKKARFIP